LLTYEYYDTLTPAAHLATRDCLERAVEIDPDYAEAWGLLAYMYIDEGRFGFNPRPELYDSAQVSMEAAQRAVALDVNNQSAQAALAMVHFVRRDMDQFRPALERTLEANPNDAAWVAWMGALLSYSGERERGISLVRKAQALNPAHPTWFHWTLAWDLYLKEDYEEALAEAQKFNLPGFFLRYLPIAATYAQLGRIEEAKVAVAELHKLWPGYSVEQMALDQNFLNMPETEMIRIQEGLRKAGLPEVSKDN